MRQSSSRYVVHDFEDYYQEVCLQIWRSKDYFQQEAKWSTWIYRLCLNVCLTLHKKGKKYQSVQVNEELMKSSEDNHAFQNEDLQLLYAAIKQLSEVDRAIILLYLEERSYQDIAEITGTNANNIGVRINRIKERLKKLLNGKIN